MTSSVQYKIPTSQIILATAYNCRPVNRAHVENLMFQISNGADLPPITCRPSKNIPGYFEVVQGQHRYEACKALNKKEIISYIKNLTDEEVYLESIRENVVRNNLTNIDLWRIAFTLYQQGMNVKDISKILNTSDSKVRQYIRFEYYLSEDIKPLSVRQNMLEYMCKMEKSYQMKLLEHMKKYRSEGYDEAFKIFSSAFPCKICNGKMSGVPKPKKEIKQDKIITELEQIKIEPVPAPINTFNPFCIPAVGKEIKITIDDQSLNMESTQIKKLYELIRFDQDMRQLAEILNNKLKLK